MLLPVSGEGEVEGDDCPAVIRTGGDDVGELTGDPEPVSAVGVLVRPLIAGGGRDRCPAAVVYVDPGQAAVCPRPHAHRRGPVLQGVHDGFTGRDHDVAG